MEYVFGTSEGYETVLSKGAEHTNWEGFKQIERNYGGESIIDNFRIVGKEWTAEDSSGKCYDRYLIDQHYRVIDKSAGLHEDIDVVDYKAEKLFADLDYISMMADIELPSDEEV